MSILFFDNEFISIRIKSNEGITQKKLFEIRDFLKSELSFNIHSVYGVMFKEKNGKVFYKDFKSEEDFSFENITSKIEDFLKKLYKNNFLNDREIVIDVIPEEYFLNKEGEIIRTIDLYINNDNIEFSLFKGSQVKDDFKKTELDDKYSIEDIYDIEEKQYEDIGLTQRTDILKNMEFKISSKVKSEIDEFAAKVVRNSLDDLEKILPEYAELEPYSNIMIPILKTVDNLREKVFLKYDNLMEENLNKRIINIEDRIKIAKEKNKALKKCDTVENKKIKKIKKVDCKKELEKIREENEQEKKYLMVSILKVMKDYVRKIFEKMNAETLADEIFIMSQYIYVFVNMSKKDLYLSKMKRDNIIREIVLKEKIYDAITKENFKLEI